MAATVLVSFACAMQVQTFRKVNGYSYASTMCIGNLRSGTAAFSMYLRDKRPEQLRQSLYYFGIILFFASRYRRQSVHALRYSHDLGVGGMSSGQLLYDVF